MMDVVCLGLAAESVAPGGIPTPSLPSRATSVMLSASRLDPLISPAASRCQFPDCASFPLTRFRALIHQHSEGRPSGILDEPRWGGRCTVRCAER